MKSDYLYNQPIPGSGSPFRKRQQYIYDSPNTGNPAQNELEARFHKVMREAMAQNKIIEEKRIALSLRFDFNIRELYRVVDAQNLGSVTHNDFSRFMKSTGNLFPQLNPIQDLQSAEMSRCCW